MPECDVAAYTQETATTDSFLDPHHTHFILVDNDDEGSEINFRAKFESRDLYSGCTDPHLVRFTHVTTSSPLLIKDCLVLPTYFCQLLRQLENKLPSIEVRPTALA